MVAISHKSQSIALQPQYIQHLEEGLEIPRGAPHHDWGSTSCERIGATGASVSVDGAPPAAPVRTCSVNGRQQLLKSQRTDGLKPVLGAVHGELLFRLQLTHWPL